MPLSVKLSIGFLSCLVISLICFSPLFFGTLAALALTAVAIFRTAHYFMEER